MMSDLDIGRGDTFTVARDFDGFPAVRIQNTAFVEEPRWLTCSITGPDRQHYLDDLIHALVQLRDTTPE
jgi:hypothetical protein